MGKESPRINSLSWGHMSVDGVGAGKDFKLWPGGGREWDWNETNTRHSPGIQPADVDELVKNGCEAVVLSRGMLRRLDTCEETLSLLQARGISVHVAETKEAVEIYNDLVSRGDCCGWTFPFHLLGPDTEVKLPYESAWVVVFVVALNLWFIPAASCSVRDNKLQTWNIAVHLMSQ